jgi:hypothetical protein
MFDEPQYGGLIDKYYIWLLIKIMLIVIGLGYLFKYTVYSGW